MDSIFGNFQKNEENKNDNELSKEIVLNSYTNEFDVLNLENELVEFLKDKTFEIHKTTSKAYTKLGEIFYEAQEKLSNHHKGTFEKWLKAIGYNKMTAYRLISRNNLLRLNPEKKSYIESIPVSLSYEIAKESCPSELRKHVLEGRIKTLKEFNETKALEYSDRNEEMRDVTPLTFTEIDTKTKESIETFISFEKALKEKELTEDQLEKINIALEKANKIMMNAWKVLK